MYCKCLMYISVELPLHSFFFGSYFCSMKKILWPTSSQAMLKHVKINQMEKNPIYTI